MLLAAVLALAATEDPTLEKVLKEAAEKERPVLVRFHKETEAQSRWMETKVWTDPEVTAFLGENVATLRVESGRGEADALVDRYRIRAWPTMLVLDAEGEEEERLEGVGGKPWVMSLLRDAAEGVSVRSLRAKAEQKPDDAGRRGKLGIRLFLRGDPGATLHLEKAVKVDAAMEKETTKEAAFLLEVRAAMTGGSAGPLKAFLDKHGDTAQAWTVHEALIAVLSKRKDEAGQVPSWEYLVEREPNAERRNGLSWALARADREPERALALVEEALKEQPDNAAFLDTKAECLSRLGKHEEAVALEKAAIGKLSASTPRGVREEYDAHLKEIEKRRDEAKK
jgi:tetratricopeptide (TPR) repeat protein